MHIFIKDKKIYYKKNSKDELKLITLEIWKNCLKKQGWEDFPNNWNTIIDFKRFAVKENYAQGDCLFLAISYGLNIYNQLKNFSNEKLVVKSLRKLVADYINDDNFEEILNMYKIEKNNKELSGNWNPNNIKNLTQFKNIIKKNGNFWGDNLVLSILSNKLKINFLILNDDTSNIYRLGENIKEYEKTMILFYEQNIHFKVVGYFNNNKIITVFNKDKLPNSIYRLYKN